MDKKIVERRRLRRLKHRGERGAILAEMVIKLSLIAVICIPAVAATGLAAAKPYCETAFNLADSQGQAGVEIYIDPSTFKCCYKDPSNPFQDPDCF